MWKVPLQLVAALVLVLAPGTSHAQAVTILDCQGFLRASQTVQAGTLTGVSVQVEAPLGITAEGVDVTLTNVATGEKFSTSVRGGVALFTDVPPGTFTIEAARDSLQMTFIQFTAAGFAPGIAGAVGAAVIGGGTAGIAIIGAQVAESSGGSSSAPPEPTPPPGPTPAPPPPAAPNDSCRTCLPDEEPDPIDDFFGNKNDPDITRRSQVAQARLSPFS